MRKQPVRRKVLKEDMLDLGKVKHPCCHNFKLMLSWKAQTQESIHDYLFEEADTNTASFHEEISIFNAS